MNKKYFLLRLRSFPRSSLGMQSWKLQLPVPNGLPEAGASGNRVPKLELGNPRTNGFTLVEMTVVLLLITLMASVAVRETAELGFQTRYEQTKERLEMIKQAILGNPRQVINGQQAVSGFVADMGRLPDCLRELIENYNCTIAGPISTWTNSGAPSYLNVGWRGPYINISGNPADNDALTDGWGRTGTDGNYGWGFFDWDTYPPISPSSSTLNLIIQSLGKDQSADTALPTTENYDNDYPINIYPLGSTACSPLSPCFPNPTVRQQDWQVDISNGVSVSFLKLNKLLPISFCSDPTKPTKTGCLSSEIWYGGCSLAGYYNKSSCEAATPAPGAWIVCSDGTSTAKATCETAEKIWYGEGFGCSDQSKTNKTACISPAIWRSCTDNGTITNQSACSLANQTWFGDDISSISINAIATQTTPNTIPVCMKIFYRKADSTIGSLVSDENIGTATNYEPKLIYSDGSAETIRFVNFRDVDSGNLQNDVPIGNNAIGVYQYDGADCKTSNVFYPINHQMPIQVDFHPNITLPVINW